MSDRHTTQRAHPAGAPVDSHRSPSTPRRGFTLIEILVVISIIGVLAAIAIPAINNALRTANNAAQKMEINALVQAVEQYQQQYGDYPPDGSSQAVLQRHMQKLFPRMTEPDLTLLNSLTDDSSLGVPPGTAIFSGVAMDRAEAVVFFLGGFSKDVQRPLTGPGGPLDYYNNAIPNPTAAQLKDLSNYQYNATRDNALFDFKPERLTMARASATASLRSTDEVELGNNDDEHGGNDLLPTYVAVKGEFAPIVYFDSRTYGFLFKDTLVMPAVNEYNGYFAGPVGGVRPYKTDTVIDPPPSGGYPMAWTSDEKEAAAFAAVKFHNPNTFQIISPGSDNVFGSIVSTNQSPPLPVHFTTETGSPVYPNGNATTPSDLVFSDPSLGNDGFQDSDWGKFSLNGHLDNITNFSTSTLEADLK